MIQYKYGLDDGIPVHIDSLNPEKDRKDYICPGCDRILRPVLGEIREKHFRHKVEHPCSLETYLHKTGKALFEKQYRDALATKTPFNFEYYIPVMCDYCKHGPCKVFKETKTFDLAKKFTQIKVEEKDGSFIPDILLKTDSGEKIYIEIVVSHDSTQEKISSGERIIEIWLREESDLANIRQKWISEKDSRIKIFNFKPTSITKKLPKQCVKTFGYFKVYESGKCWIGNEKLHKADSILNNKKGYIKSLYNDSDKPNNNRSNSFILEIENAFYEGIKVKNCWLCRYHGVRKDQGFSKNAIFCKFLRKNCQSNQAADCKSYRPDPKAFEYQKK